MKLDKLKEKVSKLWKQFDGKKTYVFVTASFITFAVKKAFPESMPDDVYSELRFFLDVMATGSAGHGLYKTWKNSSNIKK